MARGTVHSFSRTRVCINGNNCSSLVATFLKRSPWPSLRRPVIWAPDPSTHHSGSSRPSSRPWEFSKLTFVTDGGVLEGGVSDDWQRASNRGTTRNRNHPAAPPLKSRSGRLRTGNDLPRCFVPLSCSVWCATPATLFQVSWSGLSLQPLQLRSSHMERSSWMGARALLRPHPRSSCGTQRQRSAH